MDVHFDGDLDLLHGSLRIERDRVFLIRPAKVAPARLVLLSLRNLVRLDAQEPARVAVKGS